MRSKTCLSFFCHEDSSKKFLILPLSYLPVLFLFCFVLFWMQISSAFAIIFADCHGLSCVHVQASSHSALVRVSSFEFRVSLCGVWLRCVGLAQNKSARWNAGSYVFSFFFIVFSFSTLHMLHTHMFIIPSARSLSRLWKVNIDQNWNLFYHYLF